MIWGTLSTALITREDLVAIADMRRTTWIAWSLAFAATGADRDLIFAWLAAERLAEIYRALRPESEPS